MRALRWSAPQEGSASGGGPCVSAEDKDYHDTPFLDHLAARITHPIHLDGAFFDEHML